MNNKCPECHNGDSIRIYQDKFGKKIEEFSCEHKQVNVVFTEEMHLTDSIEVRRISRREQIKKKPRNFFIALGLMLLGIVSLVIDYPYSFIIGIFLAVFGVALTPINEKREIIKEEKI